MDIKIKGVVDPMPDPDKKTAGDILSMLQTNPGKEVALDFPGQTKEEKLKNIRVFRFSLGKMTKVEPMYGFITLKVIDNGSDVSVRAAYQERKISAKKNAKSQKKDAKKQQIDGQQQSS